MTNLLSRDNCCMIWVADTDGIAWSVPGKSRSRIQAGNFRGIGIAKAFLCKIANLIGRFANVTHSLLRGLILLNVKVSKRDEFPNESRVLQARFGAAIKAHRLRLGVTQEELAWRADLHRSYLADIERGGRNVTLSSIVNLARALQITLADLLSHSLDLGIVKARDESPASLGEILLVEDNAADIEMTLRAFKCAKFANPVKVVRDGKSALDYLFRKGRYAKRQDVPPQLVLLDLNLPKISGQEVLREMKAQKATQAIPVVILSGSHDNENILQCSRLGAENYLIKPVKFDNFSKVTPKLGLHWKLMRPLAATNSR